ncbi:MAG: hypothetical protein ABIH23_22085 [bacterium]
MKRRGFVTEIMLGLFAGLFTGCSRLGFSTGDSRPVQEKGARSQPSQTPNRRSSGRRSSPGITDLKSLSKVLQEARRPLTDMQVEYLLTLKPGPEFAAKMMDILTDAQKEAIKNAGRGRRRR